MDNEQQEDTVVRDFEKRAKTFEEYSRWAIDEKINAVPLRFLSSVKNTDALLDAGGGTGFLSNFLSKHINFDTICLVDSSKDMLDEARRKEYGAELFNASIEDFCHLTNKKFDVILVRQVLHYVEDVNRVISLLRSVLNDDGVIYVGQFVVEDEKCREWHDKLMQEISKNRLRTFLFDELSEDFTKAGFEIINKSFTEHSENLKNFSKRKTTDEKFFKILKEKMIRSLTKDVREKMLVKEVEGNIYYTVNFCHLLLKKS